jgi:DNA-binding transcriptional ArsR family regulator
MRAFARLADPTRRRIVELLAERNRDAGELAAAFTVSRRAVSRHLRVLRESGLVAVRPLDALETELARTRRQRTQE